MKYGDRLIQKWRLHVAAAWVPKGARVLDIGCHEGEFLRTLGDRIQDSVGLDPLAVEKKTDRYQLQPGAFLPPTPFGASSFDVISMLATLEHMKDPLGIARECARILRPSGRLIITVPSLLVDNIMDVTIRLRILEGMSMEEHHGFRPEQVLEFFLQAPFSLVLRKPFQLGLNNLFVFERTGDSTREGMEA